MFPSPCRSVDPVRLAPAEAKSSENGSILPAGFLSLCAPQPWGPTGVPGSRPKPALPPLCQQPRSRQPPALPLVGSSGCAVPSSLSPSAGTGWGFTVVAIQQTGVSGGAGARSGSSTPGSSPSRSLPCSSSGLVLPRWLWHLKLGEGIACPKTQRIRVPMLKLLMSPVLFCLLLLFALA